MVSRAGEGRSGRTIPASRGEGRFRFLDGFKPRFENEPSFSLREEPCTQNLVLSVEGTAVKILLSFQFPLFPSVMGGEKEERRQGAAEHRSPLHTQVLLQYDCSMARDGSQPSLLQEAQDAPWNALAASRVCEDSSAGLVGCAGGEGKPQTRPCAPQALPHSLQRWLFLPV